MASPKSRILFYLLLLFTLFNANWADSSLNEIESLPHISNVQLLDVCEHTDLNVSAISASSKVVKYSSSTQKVDYYTECFFLVDKLLQKISLPIISITNVCGVKSFLHLLQLF